MIVIQLLRLGYQTFMDMVWISVGYGSDIKGGGDSLLGNKYQKRFVKDFLKTASKIIYNENYTVSCK